MKKRILNRVGKTKLRRGDLVQVIAGNDKGKIGKIIEVNLALNRARVEGVFLKTHFEKRDQKKKGGIYKKEGLIHLSNLAKKSAPTAHKPDEVSKTPSSANQK